MKIVLTKKDFANKGNGSAVDILLYQFGFQDREDLMNDLFAKETKFVIEVNDPATREQIIGMVGQAKRDDNEDKIFMNIQERKKRKTD